MERQSYRQILKYVAFILILPFTLQQLVYADPDLIDYPESSQPSKSISEPSSNPASDELPNPLADLTKSPLSQDTGTGSALPIEGSISVNGGSAATHENEVTLNLEMIEGNLKCDGNDDGIVDTADYVVWRRNLGWVSEDGSTNAADYDTNGVVDLADYDLWRSRFGISLLDVAEMAISIDGVHFDWQPFQAEITVPLTGEDGLKTVSVQFRDDFGNESEPFTDTIFFDSHGPSGAINIADLAPNDFILSPTLDLELTFEDLGSGMDGMRFSEDEGETWTDWMSAEPTFEYLLQNQTNGERAIYVEYRDKASNITQYMKTFILDTIRPVIEVSSNAVYKTNKGSMKTMILGPPEDHEEDELEYSVVSELTSQNLISNGAFSFHSINKGQLTYIPNDSFIGSGEVTVQAFDPSCGEMTQVTFVLEVKEPSASNQPNDPIRHLYFDITEAHRAWTLSRGEGVQVAILDTGIDINHNDLNENIFKNLIELNGEAGIDDDNNGFVDDFNGWDFTTGEFGDNDPSPSPGTENRHGTHLAGIIAAESNNDMGLSGIAPDAEIIPIKMITAIDFINRAIQAIQYAVAMGARVINLSFGKLKAEIEASALQLFEDAISAAYEAGALLIAAAGNRNMDANLLTPAGSPDVLSIGTTDSLDRKWFDTPTQGSNTHADLVAPGSNVYSTVPNNTYTFMSGSSMSTALVSGIAALIFSQNPEATPENVIDRLTFSAKDLGDPGYDEIFGGGRVNAFKALSYDYWSTGVIKTHYLEEPDEHNFIRHEFDETGAFLRGIPAAGAASLTGVGAFISEHTIKTTTQERAPLLWSALFQTYNNSDSQKMKSVECFKIAKKIRCKS